MSKILIKNGRVIDPANKIDEVLDILVDSGKISKVSKNIKAPADNIIDAKDKIVMPGLVDMHVHLREPGREDKETVSSGTKAAAHGGVTSVLAMPNTNPAMDCPGNINLLKDIIKKSSCVNVFICGAITKSRAGRELCDIEALKKSGAIAISDDGSSVDDQALMSKALKEAKKENILLISHCEDKHLTASGVVNLGLFSTKLGLRGISNESEYKRVEREIKLAQETGSPLHIAHISCKESVELIAKAKAKGKMITAEATPHHFSLSQDMVAGYDTNMKMKPPLRKKEDVAAIKEGLKKGIIDVIASDHAPHTENEKEIEFDRAEFGVVGLETMFSISITELINTKLLSWTELVRRLSLCPAKILGIAKGSLSVGRDCDIIVVDPKGEWVVGKDNLLSKSKNSAFLGRKLYGVVEYTLCAGQIVYKS